MITFLHRWLYEDIWALMWPNVFAPSAPSIGAVWWGHRKLKAHVTRTANSHCPGCSCSGDAR